MSHKKTLGLAEEILSKYPDLTLYELGEVVYELTSEFYKIKPVDILTFIKDPYYLGGSIDVYPYWLDFLEKVHPHPCLNMYNEVIMSVGIGAGKTSLAVISMIYEMYKLLCLKNPYHYYSIASIDRFTFSILAPDLAQGSSVAFSKMIGFIGNSPCFKDMGAVPRAKSSVSETGVLISDSIMVHVGSETNHLLGKCNFCALMDEVSYFKGREVVAKVKDLHTTFLSRRMSRFSHFGDAMPGILWMVSSPKDENDYINEAIENIKTNPFGDYFDNIPTWLVKGEHEGDCFKLFLGDEKQDPRIMEDESKITADMEDYIIDVPYKYKPFFEANIIKAIRDLAGRRVQADISLFKSKQQITNLFVNTNRFKSDVVSLSFATQEDTLDKYVFNIDYFKKCIFPEAYRFIHLDIATKKDRFGFASIFSIDQDIQISQPGINNWDAPKIVKRDRMYYVDFAVALEAKRGEEINIAKVIDFIFLLKRIGYPIKKVTSDMFQGDVTRQFLKLGGVETAHLSVDRTKEPYYSFKELVGTSKIIGVKNELLIKEIINLRDLDKKVDHPSNGSKDIADAVVGALWSCINTKEYTTREKVYEDIIDMYEKDNDTGVLSRLMKEAQYKQFKK